MKNSHAITEIIVELDTAKRKYPSWPKDIIHAVSIMNEEAGESIRAALNMSYHGESPEFLKKELIQTAAMCLRCLENMEAE